MSKVRFSTVCNQCAQISFEYESFPICRLCGDDVCYNCDIESQRDYETGRTLCRNCFVAEAA